MVYLVVAIGQFGVILLSAMAKAAGLIVGTTAFLICVATALAVALHAAWFHFVSTRSTKSEDKDATIDSAANSPAVFRRREPGRPSMRRGHRHKPRA
ncbi:hypothetical protein [Sphingomonas abietis]|uniref:Uncharacterized protein n=1 Tax=Sphingomonas abietis TaxID=3012344 RepID=A0ABY7NGJ0_9SPHN|nr:hypothetical protein [Sphingomonas abietis]WBO20680.1 hypothetical protein PBT88_10660 [Sphingomonas abietis]